MKKNFGTLLVGIVFLIFGGGYVVARLFGYDPPFFFDGWWTLFLMIPALISMVETGLHLGNSIVFVIGLLLLAWEQDWIKNLNFTLILAIVLVMLGVYFIVRAITGSRKKAGAPASWKAGNIQWRSDGGDLPTYSAFFTGTNVKSESRNLMGGTCSATFGRLRVDLSEVSVNHDITLFCNAIFGQVTVSTPKGLRIVCKNVPILGGVQLLADSLSSDANAPTVTFDCTSVLGGVTIL